MVFELIPQTRLPLAKTKTREIGAFSVSYSCCPLSFLFVFLSVFCFVFLHILSHSLPLGSLDVLLIVHYNIKIN